MKTIAYLVMFLILGALLTFGLVGVLAEPTQFINMPEYVAVKAIAFFVMVVAYKAVIALYHVAKVT